MPERTSIATTRGNSALQSRELQQLRLRDEDIFEALNNKQPILLMHNMTFEEAVHSFPLLIEALMRQHIHNALFDVLGVAVARGSSRTDYNAYEQTLFLDRNQAYYQLHGPHLTAKMLADSWGRNWEGWSNLLTRAAQAAAAGDPGAQQFISAHVQGWERLQRGFREGIDVFSRAARISRESRNHDDELAWKTFAATIRDAAEMVRNTLHAPALPEQRGMSVRPRPNMPPRRQPPARRIQPPEDQGKVIYHWSTPAAQVIQSSTPREAVGGSNVYTYLNAKGNPEIRLFVPWALNEETFRSAHIEWDGQAEGIAVAALPKTRMVYFLGQLFSGYAPGEGLRQDLLTNVPIFPKSLIRGKPVR